MWKMTNLKTNTFFREIPDNLLTDPKVNHLAKALQNSLDNMLDWVDKINYRMNIDLLPDEIIEHLLWESHITWNEGLGLATTREQKINLIKNSIELHRLKGTPAALEMVFRLINIDCRMQEWFQYGGTPYHFKLKLRVTDKGLNEDTLKLLEMLVMEYKNVRSWLETLSIYYTSNCTMYIASVALSSEKITVYPFAIRNIETIGSVKTVVSANRSHEKITLYPAREGGN